MQPFAAITEATSSTMMMTCMGDSKTARRLEPPTTARRAWHRRRLLQGNGGDCPRRKTPHRVPPCEELDPSAVRDIELVFVQKITFFLRKINRNCCHQSCTFLNPICTKSFVDWGFAPDPTGEAYSASPDPQLCLGGVLIQGEEGRGGEGTERGQERRERRGRGRKRGERRKGVRRLP